MSPTHTSARVGRPEGFMNPARDLNKPEFQPRAVEKTVVLPQPVGLSVSTHYGDTPCVSPLHPNVWRAANDQRPTRCSLRILLVDDEPDLYLACAEVLRDAGHEVHTARDGEQAVQLMTSLTIDVLLTDIRLPKRDGMSLFRLVRERWPATIVILVTAFAEVHDAIAAVREGVHDYLRKPIDGDDIALRIERIAAQVSPQRQVCIARAELARRDESEQIVGRSAVMCQMMERLNTIAASDASVLLLGETGTGKELVARALHDRSPRHGKPFVAVNCAAFPDTLLEPSCSPRTVEPCCWTRWATCRPRCRSSCCGSSRSAPSSRSGRTPRSASTFG